MRRGKWGPRALRDFFEVFSTFHLIGSRLEPSTEPIEPTELPHLHMTSLLGRAAFVLHAIGTALCFNHDPSGFGARAVVTAARLNRCAYVAPLGVWLEQLWQSGNTLESLANLAIASGNLTAYSFEFNESFDHTSPIVGESFAPHSSPPQLRLEAYLSYRSAPSRNHICQTLQTNAMMITSGGCLGGCARMKQRAMCRFFSGLLWCSTTSQSMLGQRSVVAAFSG